MNLTLRQYETAVRTRAMADNGCTGRQYDAAYPPGCRLLQWVGKLQGAARGGLTFSRYVLDDLARRDPLAFQSIRHDYPGAFPAGYLPPNVRRWNAEHRADLRAAWRS